MHSIEIHFYWIKSTWMICRASLSHGHNEVHIGGISMSEMEHFWHCAVIMPSLWHLATLRYTSPQT